MITSINNSYMISAYASNAARQGSRETITPGNEENPQSPSAGGAQDASRENTTTQTRQSRGAEKGSENAPATQNDEKQLSDSERKELEKLKKRDAEVRQHEQAHLAAAGSLSQGGASFEYQQGPDGKRYAVGGEVSIDTSKVAGDPRATLAKARQIRQAALAPAQPSSQDRRVAADAARMEAQASREMSQTDSSNPAAMAQAEDATTSQTVVANSDDSANTPYGASSSDKGNQQNKNSQRASNFYKQIQTGSFTGGVASLDFYI